MLNKSASPLNSPAQETCRLIPFLTHFITPQKTSQTLILYIYISKYSLQKSLTFIDVEWLLRHAHAHTQTSIIYMHACQLPYSIYYVI